MDEFNIEEFLDEGCPSCGANAGEDCFDSCMGIPVPPQMWGLVEEQMAYVTHKVANNVMRNFKRKIFTEKMQDVMKDWGDFTNFALALYNAKELYTADQVIRFFRKPNLYTRQYVLWNELGKPIDNTRETWTMFMEALRNYNGKQT